MPSAIPVPGVTDAEARSELPASRALVPGLVFLVIGLVAGDIVQLAGYALLAVGLCHVLRRHRPGRQGPALLDAGLLAVSGAVLIWVYLVLPAAGAADLSLATLIAACAHPVGALLCLGLVGALATRRGARNPVPRVVLLLAGTLTVMLVADLARLVAELHGAGAGTWWISSMHIVAAFGLVAAGPRPGCRALDEIRPSEPGQLSRRRLLARLAATLVTPAVVALEAAQGRSLPAGIVVFGTVAAVVLVALRATGVLRRLAASQDALTHQTTHDALTGIANRRLFSRRLTDVLTDGRRCSVVLIDLGEFELVNDELGHLAGDTLLVKWPAGSTRAVRVDDLVADFAGDRFAVLYQTSPPMRPNTSSSAPPTCSTPTSSWPGIRCHSARRSAWRTRKPRRLAPRPPPTRAATGSTISWRGRPGHVPGQAPPGPPPRCSSAPLSLSTRRCQRCCQRRRRRSPPARDGR